MIFSTLMFNEVQCVEQKPSPIITSGLGQPEKAAFATVIFG